MFSEHTKIQKQQILDQIKYYLGDKVPFPVFGDSEIHYICGLTGEYRYLAILQSVLGQLQRYNVSLDYQESLKTNINNLSLKLAQQEKKGYQTFIYPEVSSWNSDLLNDDTKNVMESPKNPSKYSIRVEKGLSAPKKKVYEMLEPAGILPSKWDSLWNKPPNPPKQMVGKELGELVAINTQTMNKVLDMYPGKVIPTNQYDDYMNITDMSKQMSYKLGQTINDLIGAEGSPKTVNTKTTQTETTTVTIHMVPETKGRKFRSN